MQTVGVTPFILEDFVILITALLYPVIPARAGVRAEA